ncbi:MAG: 3-deoxy-D-manno-octulosonic-acid transferase [Chlamydiales bacterium]
MWEWQEIQEVSRDGLTDAATPPPIRTDPNRGWLRFLLHAFYSVIAGVVVVIAAPWWIGRSLTDRHFRAMILGRLTVGLGRLPRTERPRILVHGVSVGEVKAAQPIVRAIQAAHPDAQVVVSATTGTGLEVARKLFADLPVVGFPADFDFLVRRFLRRVQPTCVVLIELEIWPNFLRCANRAGVPVVVANGRITDRSFQRYGIFRSTLPQFNRISLFCAQDNTYARRFAELAHSTERVVVTGNVKADGLRLGRPWTRDERRAHPTGKAPGQVELLAGVGDSEVVIVAGSTHGDEDVWIASAALAGAPGARLVLAPRHPARARDIVSDLAKLGMRAQLWTVIRSGAEAVDSGRPLVVDTIGDLEQFYALADIVFVGGSLVPHGGQNMLEPAGLGRPAVYGPHVANFSHEAALLEQHGASVRVQDRADLARIFAQLVADPARRERMGIAAIQAVETQRGASRLTLEALAHWQII